MTSGIFHSVIIESVTVPERQRKQLKNIDDLADSIKRLGLINPIVVTRDLILVAGERRLRACNQLGWTSISVQFTDELNPIDLSLIELEENIKRDDLSWPDRINAMKELHQLLKSQNSDWTQEKTAERTGWNPRTISDWLNAAEIVEEQPELKNKSLSTAVHTAATINNLRTKEAQYKISGNGMAPPAPGGPILNTDFTTWVETYDGPPFNFIHCDFPYGIGSDKFHQGATQIGVYNDSMEIFSRLCNSLKNSLDNICAADCHVIFWFSPQCYNQSLEFLSSSFVVDPYPLIWVKSDNVGVLPDPRRGYRRIYENAFFGWRGEAKILRPRANAIYLPTSTSPVHPHEKPAPVLTHFFGAFVNEYTRAFDPTAGSGTALRAASALGARLVLGLEKDPEFARRANEEFNRDTKS